MRQKRRFGLCCVLARATQLFCCVSPINKRILRLAQGTEAVAFKSSRRQAGLVKPPWQEADSNHDYGRTRDVLRDLSSRTSVSTGSTGLLADGLRGRGRLQELARPQRRQACGRGQEHLVLIVRSGSSQCRLPRILALAFYNMAPRCLGSSARFKRVPGTTLVMARKKNG